MKKTQKYVVRKVSERGEDSVVGAKTFDSLLKKLIEGKPLSNKELIRKTKRVKSKRVKQSECRNG